MTDIRNLIFLCVNPLPHITTFNNLEKRPKENIAGKGENAGNQHFLPFPQCTLLFPKGYGWLMDTIDPKAGGAKGWGA